MGASKPALPVTLCEKIAVTAKLNMIFVIWQILYRRGNTHLRLFFEHQEQDDFECELGMHSMDVSWQLMHGMENDCCIHNDVWWE